MSAHQGRFCWRWATQSVLLHEQKCNFLITIGPLETRRLGLVIVGCLQSTLVHTGGPLQDSCKPVLVEGICGQVVGNQLQDVLCRMSCTGPGWRAGKAKGPVCPERAELVACRMNKQTLDWELIASCCTPSMAC